MTAYDWEADAYGSWEFAIKCLRAQHVAGRSLTPQEMLAMVDGRTTEQVEITPEKLADMIARRLVCDNIIRTGDKWRLHLSGKVVVEIVERGKEE